MGAFLFKKKAFEFRLFAGLFVFVDTKKCWIQVLMREIVFERVEVDYNQQRSGSYQDITLGTV